jgi:hypothetical protein
MLFNNSIQDKVFGCVIGRRGITIQLPPSGLAKNIILNTIVFQVIILGALSIGDIRICIIPNLLPSPN